MSHAPPRGDPRRTLYLRALEALRTPGPDGLTDTQVLAYLGYTKASAFGWGAGPGSPPHTVSLARLDVDVPNADPDEV
jgi:hypothetical protein